MNNTVSCKPKQSKTKIGVNNLAHSNRLLDLAAKANLTTNQRTPDQIHALVSMFEESKVESPIEAMLISQMTTVHTQAMKLMCMVTNENCAFSVNSEMMAQANRLMKTFVNQIASYEKLKRGGQQIIKVDHVHVHEGGQAIVGNIQHPNTGVL